MKITFLGETRKYFSSPSAEGDAPILGNFEVKEILYRQYWQEAAVTTVTFVAPTSWVTQNLFPGRNPANTGVGYRRARYFNFRKENNKLSTMKIDDFKAESIGDGKSALTVVGSDPRSWIKTMSTASNWPVAEMETTRLTCLNNVINKLSNVDLYGMRTEQRLPIVPFSETWVPTTAQQAEGFVRADTIAPGGDIPISIEDPLPIENSIKEIFSNWPNVEIVPIEEFGWDGTISPFWRWGIRRRLSANYLFTEANGSLTVNSFAGTYNKTETLAYDNNDHSVSQYARGDSFSRANLSGPWAGISFESVTVPKTTLDAKKFLRIKAGTSTLDTYRMAIDATVNFTKAKVTPVIGMKINARVGTDIYTTTVDELVSHFSNETGWSSSAPVFFNIDSIDITDPITNNDIQFVVRGSTAGFYVPVNSPTNSNYDLRIYLDGKLTGTYSGMSSATEPGIYLDTVTNTDQIVTIQPADGRYTAGWARAFGFNDLLTGSNALTQANRNKVTRVISDPDSAHVLTDTNYGDYFRAYQWKLCTLLTAPLPEEDRTTAMTVGNYFRAYEYMGAGVTSPAAEKIPNGTIAVGDSFRRAQYYQSKVTGASVESLPSTVKTVGEFFRSWQYSQSLVTVAAAEVTPGVTAIGGYFRYYSYDSCTKLVTAATESSPQTDNGRSGIRWRANQYSNCPLLTKAAATESNPYSIIEDNYRYQQYFNCVKLTTIPEENVSATSIGNGFRWNQYSGCSSLSTAVNEVIGSSVQLIGDYFRAGLYNNTIVSSIVPEQLPSTVRSVGNSFRSSQWSGTKITAGTPEVFPEGINSIGSNFRQNQYSGCTLMTTCYPEVMASTVTSWTAGVNPSGFRIGQFQSTGILLPAAEAVLNIPDIGYQFRKWQYASSKVTRPAAEVNMPAVTRIWEEFRYGQYQNCKDLRNPNGLVEGSFAPTVMTGTSGSPSFSQLHFRSYQFDGSGIEIAITETPMRASGSAMSGNGSHIRYAQYQNCLNLLAPSIEAENPFESGYNGANYRCYQYYGCLNLVASGVNSLELSTKNAYNNPGGGSYRVNQFALTKAKDIAGSRAKYKDGTEAVEGSNGIPTTFYS